MYIYIYTYTYIRIHILNVLHLQYDMTQPTLLRHMYVTWQTDGSRVSDNDNDNTMIMNVHIDIDNASMFIDISNTND